MKDNYTARIGDKVEICCQNNNIKKKYVSKVDNVIDKKIYIGAPISLGKIVMLPVDTKCSLVFTAATNMIFACQANIIEHYKNNRLIYLVFETISKYEKVQRREFFRFQCILPLKFSKVYSDPIENTISQSQPSDGLISDLSGGGIRFIANEVLEVNDFINCVFMLNSNYILTNTKILRKQTLDNGNYKFEYRGMFTDISKNDQDVIIQYIFNAQRKFLQRSK